MDVGEFVVRESSILPIIFPLRDSYRPLMRTLTITIALLLFAGSGMTAQSDVAPPEILLRDSCGGWAYDLVLYDTAVGSSGLSSVELVPDRPGEVLLLMLDTLWSGADSLRLRVELAAGLGTSGGRLVVADVAGNRDSIRLDFQYRSPSFSDTALLLIDVGRNERRTATLRIANPGRHPMLVERLRFRSGRHFSVVGTGPGGASFRSVAPGDTTDYLVLLTQGIARVYDDTLVVTIDCRTYEIPVGATLGRPLLAVTNLDFWQVLIGSEECTDLRITNPGSDTVYISAIEVGGGEYRFDTAAIPFLPDRVGPGGSIDVPICFLPRRLGLLLGTVTFVSSAADTVAVVARLVGIGVNSFNSAGFDSEGRELQITVVPQQRYLTVVSEDRSRDLESFRLFTMRGQEVQIEGVELIGQGWWQIRLAGRLNIGMYYLQGESPGKEPLTVKFVVLE